MKKPVVWERMLCTPPLRKLGRLAYWLYLIHLPVLVLARSYSLRALEHLHVPHPGSFSVLFGNLFGLTATVLLAELSWRYFEGPLLRIGHRYRY